MSEPLRTVNVGLIGLGTVGGGVARLIKSHHDEYLAAYGIDLKLTRACALAWEQAEAAGIEREAFTSDWHDVVTDPAVDIVVELIGGEHPATEIFTTAFEHGKHVSLPTRLCSAVTSKRLPRRRARAACRLSARPAAAAASPSSARLSTTWWATRS